MGLEIGDVLHGLDAVPASRALSGEVARVPHAASGELYMELARLRRGHGVRSPREASDLGPWLRALCRVEPHDGPASVRSKLQATLNALLDDLSPDEQLVARAALGLHPEVTGRLAHRTDWLARRVHVSSRTAMRRIDEALRLLADAAVARAARDWSPPRVREDRGEDWLIDEIRTVVRLDKPAAEIIQERRIVAARSHIVKIRNVFGLPSQTKSAEMDILFGGRLSSIERHSTTLSYEIELPSTLMRGDTHSYAVQVRFTDRQPPAPFYVVQPTVYVGDFVLRIRFDPARLPTRVWRIEGVRHMEIDEPGAIGELIGPDRAGEVMAEFHDLTPGLAYGVALSRDRGVQAEPGFEGGASRPGPHQPAGRRP